MDREAIACVYCRKPMSTLRLFDVPVDRCDKHGVWLARDELETIVAHASAGKSETGRALLDAVLDVFYMW